uniref:NADH-ubiquinone oxidoreductase chain 6 n=1 Tax=Nephus oblongosignatus TaxID=2772058 RepID=A0A7H1DNN9_9CUCU|nr:NADH dehydrogenase subunit 6 [Nephus oblongosignatus]QNS38584.1 NADH dehydrogenase subunit 6 [Nephus oblongosignatus]
MLMLMLFMSLIMLFLNHPLSMGFMILIQTILICLKMGLLSVNFWFSYIMILIMIGGLLILFIYMTSIASNEKFKLNIYLFLLSIMLLMSFIFIIMKNDPKMPEFLIKNNLPIMNENMNFFFNMSKYYNYPSNKLMIFSIIYLLISLIISVKICKVKSGPLRQLFYENTNSKNFSFNKNY